VFEALVITLREGVEAALVLAIALAFLKRRGLERRIRALFLGAGLALLASAAAAIVATRVAFNEELAEGIAMLTGAALVASLVWWMQKAAPHMKQEVERGIERAGGAGAVGVFVFAFLMVFREGAETAVFLSAAGFTSHGLSLWVGALLGLVLAIAFGLLFARGSLRVPLKPFFSVTMAVLTLVAFQLLVGGLHELSEAEVLPASRQEMALIGPLVKNELLLFTLTVLLAAGWLLLGGQREPAAVPADAHGPEARLARAARQRERARRRWTGVVALLVVGLLSMAFVQRARAPERPPALPVPVVEGAVHIDTAPLADGHLHFFEVALRERPVRIFAVQVGEQVRVCLDACEICGDKGYFEDGSAVVCRNCMSPIVRTSLGRAGGCNPIPLPNRGVAAPTPHLEVLERDLRGLLPTLEGR
jgi:FTR1 family protein